MIIFERIIFVLWAIILAVWLISALGMKRGRRGESGALVLYRVLTFIVIFLLFKVPGVQDLLVYRLNSPIIGWLGVILCATGIAFAISARFYLGRNWGMPMTVKENPELITSGPYKLVRHPIYTGVILGILGSGIVLGVLWFFIFILASLYFIYSATREEKIMLEKFPEEYRAYMNRSKKIIPFVY